MFDYFFNQVKGVIDSAKGLSKSQKTQINDTVSYAISMTETHMGRYGTNEYDRSSQMLSLIWLEAANKLLQIQNPLLHEFANTMKEKSNFWTNPYAFDYSQPKAYEMTLGQVKKKLKELTA